MNNFLEKRVLKVVFDTASTDSAGVANTTVAAHPTGVFIPDNAIITNAFYEVNTTFTSAASTATIAIMAEGPGDIVAGLAINSGTTIWNAGLRGTIVGNWVPTTTHTAIEEAALQAASWVKVDGQKEITFTVGVQVLVLGKLTLYLEYIIGD